MAKKSEHYYQVKIGFVGFTFIDKFPFIGIKLHFQTMKQHSTYIEVVDGGYFILSPFGLSKYIVVGEPAIVEKVRNDSKEIWEELQKRIEGRRYA